ncbi:MAG: hypothetical protein LBL80_00525 [Ruminococcus sp.]|jgi:predicted protein tyrosine phosphatase|nr:hypothetical protein [Ruminococcus sp.]
MNIKICSFEDIEDIAKTPFEPKTALISISDYDDELPQMAYEPEHILRFVFEDISIEDLSEEELIKARKDNRLFTENQAEKIAEFILPLEPKIDLLICQCIYGQSRSAGCAAAIKEYFYKSGIDIFADYKYTPNKLVFNKTLKALKKYGKQV